jgi:molybdopterin synthase sulfur carrier subunit
MGFGSGAAQWGPEVVMVLLRYWAGARAAAGVAEESVDASTLQAALDAARGARGASFARVIGACAFIVDEQPVGVTPHEQVALTPDSVVEVLPPFAGGAGDSGLSAGGSGMIDR